MFVNFLFSQVSFSVCYHASTICLRIIILWLYKFSKKTKVIAVFMIEHRQDIKIWEVIVNNYLFFDNDTIAEQTAKTMVRKLHIVNLILIFAKTCKKITLVFHFFFKQKSFDMNTKKFIEWIFSGAWILLGLYFSN